MQNLIDRLEKKGWSAKDIEKAAEIIHNAKQLKTNEARFLEKRVYWILLFVIIAANFAISVAFMPVLVALRGMLLYFVIIILGLVFGLLFELVIRSIEHLEKKHHVFLAIIIPTTALINFFAATNMSNNIAKTLNLTNIHNSLATAAAYATAFVLPYAFCRFILKIEYYSKE